MDSTDWPPFADLGFEFCRTHNRALSFQDLMYEIGVKGRPVAVRTDLAAKENSAEVTTIDSVTPL